MTTTAVNPNSASSETQDAARGIADPGPYKKVLVAGTINPAMETMEYAVRGQLVLRAEQHARRLAKASRGNATETDAVENHAQPKQELPFGHVTYCNIGNPQSVGQIPITFMRQVLAAVVCPDLILNNPTVASLLPTDVVARAKGILGSTHGVGAYSESRGIPFIRKNVAEALEQRDDGAPSHPDHIFLTNGASDAVKTILSLLIRSKTDGILIPIPQYPLYSATLQALGGHQVGYYLDETNQWSLAVNELQVQLDEAKTKGIEVRALCVINPGNPTGQTLSKGNIVEIVRFCEEHNLVLMADEVYQRNIYDGSPFVSFKKVVHDLQSPVELASFHSISKGFTGECGLRGGFVELHNFDEHALDIVYKVLSVSLCSNIPGQVAVDLMMKPPVPGEPSYELYEKEAREILESLGRKARKLADALNTFQNVICNPPQGAMYLFPQVLLPAGAERRAKELKLSSPDVLYCLELLDATGICVVPGSGFGQRPGTLHFRTTFLPPEDQIDSVIVKMKTFHHQFLKNYAK